VEASYQIINNITLSGSHFRSDIASKAFRRWYFFILILSLIYITPRTVKTICQFAAMLSVDAVTIGD
jgi:hypothetical protein